MRNKLLSMALTAILLVGTMIPAFAQDTTKTVNERFDAITKDLSTSETLKTDKGEEAVTSFARTITDINGYISISNEAIEYFKTEGRDTSTMELMNKSLEAYKASSEKNEITYYAVNYNDTGLYNFITDPKSRQYFKGDLVYTVKTVGNNSTFNSLDDMYDYMFDKYKEMLIGYGIGDTLSNVMFLNYNIVIGKASTPLVMAQGNLTTGSPATVVIKKGEPNWNDQNANDKTAYFMQWNLTPAEYENQGGFDNFISNNLMQSSGIDVNSDKFQFEYGYRLITEKGDNEQVELIKFDNTTTETVILIEEKDIPLGNIEKEIEIIVKTEYPKDNPEVMPAETPSVDPTSPEDPAETPEPTTTPEEPIVPETPSDEPKDPINPIVPVIPVVLVLGFLPFLLPPLFRRVDIYGVGEESRFLNKAFYKVSKNSNFVKINITEGLKLHKADEILKIEIKDSLYKKILFGEDGKKYVIANTDTYTAKAEIVGLEGNYYAMIDPNNDLIKKEIQK